MERMVRVLPSQFPFTRRNATINQTTVDNDTELFDGAWKINDRKKGIYLNEVLFQILLLFQKSLERLKREEYFILTYIIL